MGVIHIKKKRGTSFLEIIIALSIIGIISVTIFNNIAFSLKVNNEINAKQNSSLLAQHVFEEIKNMGNSSFKRLVESMATNSTNLFLGSEFDEIEDIEDNKEKFKEDLENINTFKVFKKKNTELYVKVTLPKFDKDKQGGGIAKGYTITSTNTLANEWRNLDECDVGMEITKLEEEDLYDVIFTGSGSPDLTLQIAKEKIIPKVSLEGNEIKIYLKNEMKFTETISDETIEANIFLKNNTEEDFIYILSNDKYKKLNLYVDRKASGEMKFTTYGSNIRVYSNKNEGTPDGENIITESICDFVVEVYLKNENNKMMELKGEKKFMRFEL